MILCKILLSSLYFHFHNYVRAGILFNFIQVCISRAGHKLEAAIEQLGIDVAGKVALDSGLSTGGFTDCLLQYGASFVYGVDVGYGQVRELNG